MTPLKDELERIRKEIDQDLHEVSHNSPRRSLKRTCKKSLKLIAALEKACEQRDSALNDLDKHEHPASAEEIQEMKDEDDAEILAVIRGEVKSE